MVLPQRPEHLRHFTGQQYHFAVSVYCTATKVAYGVEHLRLEDAVLLLRECHGQGLETHLLLP